MLDAASDQLQNWIVLKRRGGGVRQLAGNRRYPGFCRSPVGETSELNSATRKSTGEATH